MCILVESRDLGAVLLHGGLIAAYYSRQLVLLQQFGLITSVIPAALIRGTYLTASTLEFISSIQTIVLTLLQ